MSNIEMPADPTPPVLPAPEVAAEVPLANFGERVESAVSEAISEVAAPAEKSDQAPAPEANTPGDAPGVAAERALPFELEHPIGPLR